MKSYIQGLITGSVLVFGFMVLTASNEDAYWDTDDLMSKLNQMESDIRDIKRDISSIEDGVDCN